MQTQTLAGLTGLALAAACTSAIAGGYIELYYSNSELELSEGGFSIEEDFDGVGVRGGVDLTPEILLRGEYTTEEADLDGFDLDIARVGIGYQALIGPTTALYLGPDYVRFEAGDGEGETDDGFGLFVGLRQGLGPSFAGSVEAGYIDLEFEKGPYAEATLTALVNEQIGLFGRYRIYALEDKEFSSLDVDFSGFQVGVRIGF